MTSKKKIIDTLQKADKASVEKLMADEAKKNEIFAKALERAGSGSDGDFAETVSGVEHYDRKISMTRIASIAAAAVLAAGGVLAGFKLMKNDKFQNNHNSDVESTTDATDTANTTDTVNDDVPEIITKDWLCERIKSNYDRYRKLSCEFEVISNDYDDKAYQYSIKFFCKIDKDANIGWTSMEKKYDQPDNEKNINTLEIEYSFNGYNIEARGEWEYSGEAEIKNKTYDVSYSDLSDHVYLNNTPSYFSYIEASLIDADTWEITGERTENGRKIVTVEGKDEFDFETNEPTRYFTCDIDAATGFPLSESVGSIDREIAYSIKFIDYKFDDEAEAPMSPAEFRQELIEGGFEKAVYSKYDLDVLDGVSPATTTVVYKPVTETITTEAHPVPEELTGDFLRERCLNATHYYEKLSADIHTFHAMYAQNLADWETTGTVKIDNTVMNGEMYEEMYEAERKPWDRSYHIYLNNIYVYINQNDISAQNQNNEGKYCYISSAEEKYPYKGKAFDRPVLSGCLRFVGFENQKVRSDGIEDIINETPWTVTGERYENGRRIASVSFSYELLREGKYEPRYVTADIDAETGVCFAFEICTDHEYLGNGYLLESFNATNVRFDDEADVPRTAKEVKQFIEENGYDEDAYFSDFSVCKVEDLV